MSARVSTVRASQIERCPRRALSPRHYRDDGRCLCQCFTPGCTFTATYLGQLAIPVGAPARRPEHQREDRCRECCELIRRAVDLVAPVDEEWVARVFAMSRADLQHSIAKAKERQP